MSLLFFFNDTATTEIYTLSLHDALPICATDGVDRVRNLPELSALRAGFSRRRSIALRSARRRSEEHTSELQSQSNLVCRLLLEKKNRPDRTESPRLNPARRAACARRNTG